MNNLFFLSTALMIPFFLCNLKCFHPGLATGFYIALAFFCSFISGPEILPLVSGITIFLVCYDNFHHRQISNHPPVTKSLPSLFLMVIFVFGIGILISLENSFVAFADFLKIDINVLKKAEDIKIISYMTGPIISGILCDRKGPFHACITLAFIAEFSVYIVSKCEQNPIFFFVGSFFIHLCGSGFLVILPRLINTFFGNKLFKLVYPITILLVFLGFISSKFLFPVIFRGISTPAISLIALTFTSVFTAFFLFLSWQRRFVLVMDK